MYTGEEAHGKTLMVVAQAKARHTLQRLQRTGLTSPSVVGTEELHALSHPQVGTQDDTTTLGKQFGTFLKC